MARKSFRSDSPPPFSSAACEFCRGWQGRGIGSGLLKDAMQRTLQAADIAGIRAFVVHAKDESARRFHEHFGFTASPSDTLHLFRLIKELKRLAYN